MKSFSQVLHNKSVQDVIKAVFDADYPVDGGWGYTKELATVFKENPEGIPLAQYEHILASMRAHLKMNIIQDEKDRYGSINLNESNRETLREDDKIYHKITYEIAAMKESDYARFIEEYKAGYGTDGFNIDDHFKRRKAATLIRIEPYWFEVSQVI